MKVKINNDSFLVEFERSTFKNYKSFFKLIRSHSLFESAGEIQLILNDVERGYINPENIEISIATLNNTPVACALKNRNKLLCYVKNDYRRLKIGSHLINLLKSNSSYATIGFLNSDDFWKQLNVTVLKF